MVKGIRNLFIFTRCVKKTISHGNKKFNVYVIKDSPARATIYGTVVNNHFFEKYNEAERLAILYHEEYHKKFLSIIKSSFNIFRFLSFKKANWQEEFSADEYSLKKNGRAPTISFLKKAQKDYDDMVVKYDPRTHPPISERIKNLKK